MALSPDGSQVAYSSNADGQYNLWRQPADGGEPVRLTGYTEQSVRELAWSPDGDSIVYTADRHGDEFHQIFRIPAGGGTPEPLTDSAKVQHHLAAKNPFSPDGRLLAFAANDRTPTDQDVLVRDLATGEVRRLQHGSEGILFPVAFSPAGDLLLVARETSNTNVDFFLVVPTAGGEPVLLTPHDGDVKHDGGVWASDGSGFWLLTDAGREYSALLFRAVDSAELVGVDLPEWDVEQVAAAADGSLLAWTGNEDGYSRLRGRNPRTGEDVSLPRLPDGAVGALQVSRDGRRLAFLINTATGPTEVAVVDVPAGTLRVLTRSQPPAAADTRLIAPTLIRYTTHDGRSVASYLYRPSGPGPFPVVLSIHGGPEAQERPVYAYSGLYQYLLAHGVGVLAPNVRGSTGYGGTYQKLIHRDWGGAELGDFEQAVYYLRGLDWVDPDRIGVFGGSFGGFATLSCVSRLPDLWAAGVCVVGPSNLLTFVRSVPPTWRRLMASWVGDPDTDEDLLRARSPLTYADQIRTPLFVIQGARDPRVAQAESDQIVASLRARGVPVRYDVYADEGHGFTKRENELRALGDAGDFLVSQLTRPLD